MDIRRFINSSLLFIMLGVPVLSCGHSKDSQDIRYVFLDLSIQYSSLEGEEASDFLRSCQFGKQVELVDQVGEYSLIKVDGEEGYMFSDALMGGDDFAVLQSAFAANANLRDKVYTPQGRRALVLALQGRSDRISIVPSRPSPDDNYFIHYAFDVTDKKSSTREYVLFGVNDLAATPVKLCTLPIPIGAPLVEDVVFENGGYSPKMVE